MRNKTRMLTVTIIVKLLLNNGLPAYQLLK